MGKEMDGSRDVALRRGLCPFPNALLETGVRLPTPFKEDGSAKRLGVRREVLGVSSRRAGSLSSSRRRHFANAWVQVGPPECWDRSDCLCCLLCHVDGLPCHERVLCSRVSFHFAVN